MTKPRRAPDASLAHLAKPPSLEDFIRETQPGQDAWIALHRQVIEDVEKVQMAAYIVAQANGNAPAPASKSQAKQKQPRARADLPPGALRTPEAARYLGIGERTLIKYRDKGEIPCIKIGSAVCYLVADLDAYARQNKEQR